MADQIPLKSGGTVQNTSLGASTQEKEEYRNIKSDDHGRVLIMIGNYNILTAVDSKDDDLIYIGRKLPAQITSAGGWQIKRVDKTDVNPDNMKVIYANGDTLFDKVWEDRETYSYNA